MYRNLQFLKFSDLATKGVVVGEGRTPLGERAHAPRAPPLASPNCNVDKKNNVILNKLPSESSGYLLPFLLAITSTHSFRPYFFFRDILWSSVK